MLIWKSGGAQVLLVGYGTEPAVRDPSVPLGLLHTHITLLEGFLELVPLHRFSRVFSLVSLVPR